MYESFYGLKEKPFTLLPDPEYLYLSPKHQRALTLLEYGMMNQASFSVICGDTGAGKTTLIRRLLTELGEDTTVGLITNTHRSFGELLNWVLMAFGLDAEGKSKAQMHQMFISFLIEQYASQKHVVLIVDEAQNMSADTLEELRMLSNINADKDQVLQIILAGQPALRETLKQPELMQFAQRIAVDYYLEALSAEETRHYIQHRLKVAGAEEEIFTADASEAIYRYSGGTPRLINLLCDTTLVYGFAEQTKVIGEELVHDVVEEQHRNSIIPTFHTDRPHKSGQGTVHKENLQSEKEESREESVKAESLEKIQKTEDAIARLAERAVQVVNQAEQNIAATQAKAGTTTKSVNAEDRTSIGRSSEKVEDIVRNARVTPISSRQFIVEEARKDETEVEDLSAVKNNGADIARDTEIEQEAVEAKLTEKTEVEEIEKRHHDNDERYIRNERYEEHYPVVHIEESPKKSLSLIMAGLIGGMLVSSVAMAIVIWMIMPSNDSTAGTQVISSEKPVDNMARRELELLQKERDAALAESRALERERDAALSAAKVQEQMRAAEMRAAEILAEQERAASARLNEARTRIREAELAERRAREREQQLRVEAERRRAEEERRKQEELRIAGIREQEKTQLLEAQKVQEIKSEPEESRVAETVIHDSKASAAIETDEESVTDNADTEKTVTRQEEKVQAKTTFRSNPCDSPSAKFLSTCKK